MGNCNDRSTFNLNSVWKERLLVIVVLTVQFVALCTDTFLYPFFPQEATAKGLTPTYIGIVFSSFELARFVSSLATGCLISKSNPKHWCVVGGGVTSVCCVLFGLVDSTSGTLYLVLCSLTRFLAGSGAAMLTVAAITLLLKVTSYSSSFVIGAAEGTQALGWITGPALGAGLYELTGSYTGVFWILGGSLFLFNFVQALVLPSLESEETSNKTSINILNIPGVAMLFFQVLIYGTNSEATMTGAGNYLSSTFQMSASTLGVIYGLWSIGYLIGCLSVPPLVNKGFIYSQILIAWLAAALLYMLAGPSPLLEVLFNGQKFTVLSTVCIAMTTLMNGFQYVPAFQAAMDLAVVNGHEKDSTQLYGAVTGTLNSAYSLGALIGPVFGGAITQVSDFTWTLTSLAGLSLLVLIVMSTYLLTMTLLSLPLKPTAIEKTTLGDAEERRLLAEQSDEE